MPSKAEFCAMRETVGLSQSDVADALGVRVESVKRWESPKFPQTAPEDAWDVLFEAFALHQKVVDFAVDKAVELASGVPGGHPVELPYWRTQAEYDSCHPQDPGPFAVANANARAVAARLRDLGISVTFAWGSESVYSTATEGLE